MIPNHVQKQPPGPQEGKSYKILRTCKYVTCKYSLNTCKSMKLGNWHQIDLKFKYIHKTCSTLPLLCHARHALLQADRDGDGLINPDEFYRVMRKSWHPKMLRNVWRLGRTEPQHFFLESNCPFSGIHLRLWWETLVYLTKAGDESTGWLGQWWRLSRPGPGWMVGWVEMYPKRKSWSSWSFQIYVSSIYCIYIINK